MPKQETLDKIRQKDAEFKQALKVASDKLKELEALKVQASCEPDTEPKRSGELH